MPIPGLINEDWRMFHLNSELEREAIRWSAERGLIANVSHCNNCNIDRSLRARAVASDGYWWKCPRCSSTKRIREDSFFERSKLTIRTILMVIYFWCFDLPQKDTIQELSISGPTAVDWQNFIRDICHEHLIRHPIVLRGIRNGAQVIVV